MGGWGKGIPSRGKRTGKVRHRGVGQEICDESWQGVVLLERKVCVCVLGEREEAGEIDWDQRGFRSQLRRWGLNSIIWDGFF